ncbi:uncharacterized protein ACMZJ9_009635 [Mantella aurantiaca]
MDKPSDLPLSITDWTKEHVKFWVTEHLQIGQDEGDILYKENVTGRVLNVLSREDFLNMKITYGTATLIIHERTQMTKDTKQGPADLDRKGIDVKKDPTKKLPKNKNEKQKKTEAATVNETGDQPKEILSVSEGQPCCSEADLDVRKVTCTPYPFDSTHESKRYTQHHFLMPEAGTSNYMDPVHEYKEFTNTGTATEEDKKMKFCNELFRFAAACMNVRTNGTIHFGVRDKPHGEIIGVHIVDREVYGTYFYQMMSKYFEENQSATAKQCIRPPRLVDVLHQDNTQSDLVVIEVDVVPEHAFCASHIFHTYLFGYTDQKWMKSKEISCFVRDGESSKDLLLNIKQKDADFKKFYSKMIERDEARKKAEDNQKSKENQKMEQGRKLVSLITGNRDTLDNSYFKWYILVANKCHESHTKHLEFLHEIPWFAVLDFDPNSCANGLCKVYREKRVANLHFPHQYQNMDSVTAEKLEGHKLSQQTSWIFCNGRLDLNSQEYKPLSNKLWHQQKAAEVRRMVSFLCRKDLMQPGKFLVVFLLLSNVEDQVDPMNEVFSAFYQELGGMSDILCICECEETFHGWRDLQCRIISEEEMEERCIYNLDIENVNGTLLKLKSNTRSSSRFLPSHGGSTIILQRKDEDLMTFLDVLCVNECRDTEIEKNESKFREFIKAQEEHFYRGGKATCWNFYFSSENYTGPFIKRDNYEKLRHLIESSSDEKSSVRTITLYHHPGCGGTTTAMHVLWELRETFRCAILKRRTDNFSDIAKEVIMLATQGSSNTADHYPVLLLVDDFDEEEHIFNLQSCIRAAIAERSIRCKKPVVIILHCMRSQNPEQSSKIFCTKSVALIHKLSEQEKRAFETKLKEIEQRHKKPEDFYSFMIMKSDFDVKYVENVARNILKGLNTASKEAQLISILALLNKYMNDSTISLSMCEEFLGITAKKCYWDPESIEEKLGGYFALLLRTEVEEYGGYQGLRIIHPLIAGQCIEELKHTYGMSQSSIMLNMLQTNIFYETMIGRDILAKNVQSMLVTRQRKEHGDETDTLFSPLIEEIHKDEGHKIVEKVLKEGTIRFNQNPYILQALARYFYIKLKVIDTAFQWAKKAKQMSPTNSYILNTLGQIYKTQLKMMMAKQNKMNVSAQDLKNLLDIAENASKAFKECQAQTEKTESERDEYGPAKLKDYYSYNTAGYSGQIEVCLCTVDVLLCLPWFNTKDKISRSHLRQYLSGKWDISVDNVSKCHEEICCVLQDFRHFLTKLKSCLKENFDYFDDYFVFFKQKSITRETFEFKIRKEVENYYKTYRRLFCKVEQLADGTDVQKKSTPLLVQDNRLCLEFYKADKFSGILQYLNPKKDVNTMQLIVDTYRCLLEKSPDTCSQRDKQNSILANIVLHCISAKSDKIAPIEKLKECLREVLQITGFDHRSSDPYFLASLLFWPQDKYKLDPDSKLIGKYINSMRKSSRGQYRHMHHTKYPTALFFLADNKGLKRLVHKGRIDQSFSAVPQSHLNSLWQGGEIWKEPETQRLLSRVQGRAEGDSILVEYGGDERVTIPVRAAHLGELRSGKSIEQVSFFLGFSIGGPIAYDIERISKYIDQNSDTVVRLDGTCIRSRSDGRTSLAAQVRSSLEFGEQALRALWGTSAGWRSSGSSTPASLVQSNQASKQQFCLLVQGSPTPWSVARYRAMGCDAPGCRTSRKMTELEMDKSIDVPSNIEEWTRDHVKLWITKQLKLDSSIGDIIYNQEVTGMILKVLTKKDLVEMGIKHGPASFIACHLENLNGSNKQGQQDNLSNSKKGTKSKQNKSKSEQSTHATAQELKNSTEGKESENTSKESGGQYTAPAECSHSRSKITPCTFDCNYANKCYTQHHCLPPESGISNYIDPAHEYKEFTNTENATVQDMKMKFCNEVFEFSAACMNARTNGTIHFGVRDKPHGEIIGVHIENCETYINYIDQMMKKYFEEKQWDLAKQCIRPPRFVRVLCQDNTKSDLFVIEVDVVPAHVHCHSQTFHTYQQVLKDKSWKKSLEKHCFLRDGASIKDLLDNAQFKVAELNSFYIQTKDRDNARKIAEDNQRINLKKNLEQGSKLVSLLTGNKDTLDNSYYKWYILVVNKCQESHTKNLNFMHEVPWFAVLDFDPESITSGLCKAFQEKRKASLHFPSQYQNMDNVTNEKLEELKLYQKTAWIFCNGRLDLESQDYKPLNFKLWHKEKAADVRRLVSFLSRRDVMERGKFLVVFLLFSTVEDPVDPMNEVFSGFYQELSGMEDILCICECEETFQSWRGLQARLVSEEEMENRCTYSLGIEDVNGTILKLKSNTQSSNRFLPISTILQRKDEDMMPSLDILSANECHDTEIERNKPKFEDFIKTQEEHFYKGGKATWWNFYFSQKKYTGPFIKRDIHNKLKEQIEFWSQCDKQRSVKIITLFHHPGCGGSTTAMHVLWELRNKFRCATLKRKTDSFTDIAGEVINLALFGPPSGMDYYPVLLLVDDYEEEENVFILQNCIQSVISERHMKFEKPVVIILNCMRSQNPEQSSKSNYADSVPLTYKLSEQEQRAFEKKLTEIEKKYEKPDDFYSFMIMKSNFDKKYIESVVRNILKGLNNASKQAQLISILALLNKYVKDSTISASMCEEFLGITAKKTYWGYESIEDKMGAYFTILLRTEVEEYGRYQGLRISHPLIAKQCIEELKNTYSTQQSSIMLSLLDTNLFHSNRIGREILCQNMQSILVTRHRKEHGDETDTLFSPLIEEIQEHEGSLYTETVLKEGTLRFNQNPYICQALARHYYIREKNILDAFHWAKEAKRISPTNSFILDTLGQIYKTQLKSMMDDFSENKSVTGADLKNLLETAENASIAFRECQEQTEKTERERKEYELPKARRYRVYNTAGYLGQIEVCLYTIDILLQIPWFNSKDTLSKKHLLQYLSGKWDISVDNVSEDYQEFCNVLSDFRSFLIKLNTYLKDAFDFFQDYFVYLKQRNLLKESTEFKARQKVSEYYRKYRQIFCNSNLMQIADEEDTPRGGALRRIEDYRLGLQSFKADRFAGILEYLTDPGKQDNNMEAIVKAYKYLLQNRTDKFIMRDKQNFILANIVLHCISPKSTLTAPSETLKKYLREILQLSGLDHKFPEPYFLASLLFWPHDIHQLDSDSKHIAEYITSMRNKFRGQYRHMCHAKQPIAHFYLGKQPGLGRLVHKGKIDRHFPIPASDLNSLWQSGDIWKDKATKKLLLLVNGRAEDNMIYVECEGGIKIPVRPVYLGQLRSGKSIERVSFYLGFSMDGLIAYNIERL